MLQEKSTGHSEAVRTEFPTVASGVAGSREILWDLEAETEVHGTSSATSS